MILQWKENKIFTDNIFYTGGQTGVDRAVMDFCINFNLKYKGFYPKGRIAEDGIIPEKYNLSETKSSDVEERTVKNIINTDISVVFIKNNQVDTGTKFAIDHCIKVNKYFVLLNLDDKDSKKEFLKILKKYTKVNIAGARESNSKGIYRSTLKWSS